MLAASSWTGTTTDSSGTESSVTECSGGERSGAPGRATVASAFDGPAFDELSRSVILGRIVSRPPVAVVARGGTYFEPCIYSGP